MGWTDGYIAVDWGTTNRRAYLIDGAGQRMDEFDLDEEFAAPVVAAAPLDEEEPESAAGD